MNDESPHSTILRAPAAGSSSTILLSAVSARAADPSISAAHARASASGNTESPRADDMPAGRAAAADGDDDDGGRRTGK